MAFFWERWQRARVNVLRVLPLFSPVLLRPTLPDVRCVGFATPAAAAGGSLLASMRECVTSVALRNDMVPRMTLSSVRQLFAELGAVARRRERVIPQREARR